MAHSKTQLYLVPTPIGNLEDMTIRAVRILKEVDFIMAEDTRTSGVLLKHFGIETRMVSHHKFNEHASIEKTVMRLKGGETAALISDAGTPGISDPGYLIAKACVEQGLKVECLPGATAFVPALVVSGLPSDKFCFEGFLPQKKGRHTRLEQIKDEVRTTILYESPFRLVKTLNQLAEYCGAGRKVSVSREISKLHEENKQGTLAEVAQYFAEKGVKGEIVIVLEGKPSQHLKNEEK
ncbi:MAG: 16S rRNA (cytidine(1402)-2'-O)-methyltransferase [Breznakibacter sp.]